MKSTKIGVEIEFTGMTRSKAADAVASILGGSAVHVGGPYDSYVISDARGRSWKIVSDSSIQCETRTGSPAGSINGCELVTPILTYEEDMVTLQEIVRALRKAGGRVNGSCGIHIHLNGADQTVRSLKNWAAIVASKNDLLYTALDVKASRLRFCQKVDDRLVEAFKKPTTMAGLEDAWYGVYGDYGRRSGHYHSSRYHFLNLHSFFNGSHHTVELRGFNSTLHAGVVRSYVVLAIALNHQALTQKTARAARPQVENQKFAMRTYLNRIGLIGPEYETVRTVLTKNLSGCAAWRFGRPEC